MTFSPRKEWQVSLDPHLRFQLPIPSHFTQFSLTGPLAWGVSGGAGAHGLGKIERGSISVGLGKPSPKLCEDSSMAALRSVTSLPATPHPSRVGESKRLIISPS